MNEYFFSHARTALKYGLINLNLNNNSEILIPSYICDSIIFPLDDLNLNYVFYDININLSTNWDDLNKKISINTSAVLYVNYFGIPNEIHKFENFAFTNKIKLVEDNSHGYIGIKNKNLLNSNADFIISAPRKHLPLSYGGSLFSKKQFEIPDLPKIRTTTNQKFKFIINHRFPKLKKLLKYQSLNSYINNFSNSNFELKIDDQLLDQFSLSIIMKTNWSGLQNYKMLNFNKWKNFCKINNFTSLYNDEISYFNPWCYPILTNSKIQKNKIIIWLKKNKIIAFSWPTLPLDVNNLSKHLSEYVICLSTYSSPLNENEIIKF
tara:strand:- start:368 stop:1330 length:963 start_codon:yes stop_codon:yes gene_type:complete